MCSPVDWAVEEIPYSTECLIVEDNDGFWGPEVDTGSWLDETGTLLVVDVCAWETVDVCRLCVTKSVVRVTGEVVTWLDSGLVESLEDSLDCVVKTDTDLDVDLIDTSEVGFWDVLDVNFKDDVDLVLVDIFGVCWKPVVCSDNLSMVEVIVGPVVGPMAMFEQLTSEIYNTCTYENAVIKLWHRLVL